MPPAFLRACKWTTTMSTSDPSAETVLTLEDKTEGAKNSNALAALPDLEVIAKLANEFFAALPGQAPNLAAPTPGGVDASAVPAPGGIVPDVPGAASTGTGGFSPTPPPAPLSLLEREQAGSLTAPPTYPSATELFSFPGVPGAERGANVPKLPSPAPSFTEAELSNIPASLVDVPLRPAAFASASPPALPGTPAYFLSAAPTSPVQCGTEVSTQVAFFCHAAGSTASARRSGVSASVSIESCA